LKKIDENTLSRALSDKISTNGHKAGSIILGDENNVPTGKDASRDVEIVDIAMNEYTLKLFPRFRYRDDTLNKCVVRGNLKTGLM